MALRRPEAVEFDFGIFGHCRIGRVPKFILAPMGFENTEFTDGHLRAARVPCLILALENLNGAEFEYDTLGVTEIHFSARILE